jgi:hypothetical protein
MSYQKVVIIGAPRSGTNLLRDLICSISLCSTWPCDEINYIWRHFNVNFPSDEFPSSLATPRVEKFVNSAFDSLAYRTSSSFVIEKTCANSLRVPFVKRLLPDAKFLFIYRNGFEVIRSAEKRFKAPFELKYIAQKARYVPFSDFPYYSLRYLRHRVSKIFSESNSLPVWGPIFKDMPAYTANHSLLEVCAMQWASCVESSLHSFSSFSGSQFSSLSYEELVGNPAETLSRLLDFLGVSYSPEEVIRASAMVRTSSGISPVLTDSFPPSIIGMVQPLNFRLGYQ